MIIFNLLHQDKICHLPGEIFIEANSMLIIWMFIIFILDQLLCKHLKGRYFALHTIVNLCLIPFLVLQDIFTFYNNILVGDITKFMCGSKHALIVSMGLHTYHILFFKLKMIDIVHHIPALIGGLAGIWYEYTYIFNVQLGLSLFGIPGGIDYLLLTCYKENLIDYKIEKQINKRLNVWIRAPIGNITSFIIIIQGINTRNIYYLFIGLHGYWNSNYFMERTIKTELLYKNVCNS